MNDCSGVNVAAMPGARRVLARTVAAGVRFAQSDGVLATLEGEVPFQRGDAILTGTRGEHWPVSRERFFHTYTPGPGVAPGEDGEYVKLSRPATALQMRCPFRVTTLGGKTLTGAAGDWLLQYQDGEYGIVAEALFPERYEPLP